MLISKKGPNLELIVVIVVNNFFKVETYNYTLLNCPVLLTLQIVSDMAM